DNIKYHQNINNEIAVLRGRTLMYRVLKELHLETTFYTEGNIKTTEIYGKNVPINITLTSLDSTALGNRIKIQIKNQNNYILTDENGESEHAFGKQVRTSYATFTLTAPGEIDNDQIVWVQFNNLVGMAASFNQLVTISPVNKDASVLTISLVSAVPKKAEDIINKLIEVYNR